MNGDQIIIRRISGGVIVFETTNGIYRLSPEDLRNILFYGRRVPIIREDDDAESMAIVYGKRPGSTGPRRIVFLTATRSFSITDLSFISVVKGKWASASMVSDSPQAADHVA